MTKIRYCEYCGSTLLPNAAFCENCGRPVRPLKKKTGNGQNPAGRKAPVRPESGNKEQRTENREKSRPYVPGEKVRAKREEQASARAGAPRRPYVPGEKSAGNSRQGSPSRQEQSRRYPSRTVPPQGYSSRNGGQQGYPPRNVPPQGYPYRRQPDPEWEAAWNRMNREQRRGAGPLQYLLIGAAVLLLAAILGFAAYWFLGRSQEKREEDRRPSREDTVLTEADTRESQEAITILNQENTKTQTEQPAQTEAQTKTEAQTQTPVQTETQPQTQAPVQTETKPQTQAPAPVQTETQAPQQTASGGSYILAESSQRALTDGDVAGMSYDDMQMAINEIYARHGRRFGSSSIQSYFESQSWYQGTVEPEQFDESVFSYTEQQNIQFLLQKMGVQQ